eukprot:GHVR01184243.1.p1 GENE.GHVR01184243.1~~GHVR01184243.1.p1  ORF type:complete len:126 (+),score=5.29 GHVR01184243.1:1062-1439(+)
MNIKVKEYTLIDEIGAGAFSIVYKAKNTTTGVYYAIKKMKEMARNVINGIYLRMPLLYRIKLNYSKESIIKILSNILLILRKRANGILSLSIVERVIFKIIRINNVILLSSVRKNTLGYLQEFYI